MSDVVPASVSVITEKALIGAGLWHRCAEVVQLVDEALDHRCQSLEGKLSLSPSNAVAADMLNLAEDQRRRYRDNDLDYKLNVLGLLDQQEVGFKAVAGNVVNRERHLPRADALYVLYDRVTMKPRTLIRSLALSSLRTAAYVSLVQAVAECRIVACLGSGAVVRALVPCLEQAAVPPVTELRVYSPNLDWEALAKFWGRTRIRLRRATSAEDAVVGADMVVTATTARTPVLEDHWLAPDVVHVNLGAYEAPLSFVERCLETGTVLVDDFDATVSRGVQSLAVWYVEAGSSAPASLLPLSARRADLPRPWHVSCVGLPALDLAVARWAEAWARAEGIAQEVEF